MRRTLGWAAFAATVLVPLAAVAQGPSASRERVPTGAVIALSVVPGTGRAEVVVGVAGALDVNDFVLDGGKKVVVDFKGATLGMSAPLYDKVSRAGITNVRIAQYQSDIVRVVLELDTPREYTVVRGERDVKVSVSGSDTFSPWRASGAAKATVTSLTVNNSAAQEPAEPRYTAPAPAASPKSKRAPEPPMAEPRITITFNDVPIRDVISAFAQWAHRTIIVGSTVTGIVNATIDDQPWDIALKSVLQSMNLSALEDTTGIISVDSYTNLADREKVEPLKTLVIPVNYAKAETMSLTVKALLGAGCAAAPVTAAGATAAQAVAQCQSRGSVAFDEKTNSVIVTETAVRVAEIQSYIRDLDVRTPQVTIKAKIISVDRTGTEQLGISYDLGSPDLFSNALVTRFLPGGTTPVQGDFRVNLAGDALAGVANAGRPFKSSAALSLLYNMTLGGFNLTSFIDALSSLQLTDVQAEPSVTTADNKQAELFSGSNLAFLLTPPIIPGQIQAVQPQLQRQDIGITLRVTPHVTANRQVNLEVFAEQQTLISVTTAGPSTNKRNSKNEILVGDGETAVIGGLTQTQVSRSKSGIPFLMDLPGIGKLFSQTETVERKQDLLILITPHIVDEGEAVRPPAGRP
jgi:type IV pilus assembly protein PilQ